MIDNFQNIKPASPECVMKALETLPVRKVNIGDLILAVTGMEEPGLSPESVRAYLKKCQELSVIPMRLTIIHDIRYAGEENVSIFAIQNYDNRAIISHDIKNEYPDILALETKAIINGTRAHQIRLDLDGLKERFHWQEVRQELLAPLSSRGYSISRLEVALTTYQGGPDSGSLCSGSRLILYESNLRLEAESDHFNEWFESLTNP